MIEDPWGVKLELVEDPQLLGFHHAHTRAADPAAMLRWFEDVFGGRRGMLKGRIEGLQFGPVWLLVDRADNPPPSDGHAIDHLGFRTTDITSELAYLKGRNVPVLGEPRPDGLFVDAIVAGADFRADFQVAVNHRVGQRLAQGDADPRQFGQRPLRRGAG